MFFFFATGMVPVLHQMAQFHQHVSVDVGTFNYQPTLQGRNTIYQHGSPKNQHGSPQNCSGFLDAFPFPSRNFVWFYVSFFFFREGIPPNTTILQGLGIYKHFTDQFVQNWEGLKSYTDRWNVLELHNRMCKKITWNRVKLWTFPARTCSCKRPSLFKQQKIMGLWLTSWWGFLKEISGDPDAKAMP